MKRPFLVASWRHLLMLNFPVEPALLEPHVPEGTELDDWQGTTFMSLVGFRFLDTRVLGIGVPFHRNFDEVNLRFYVKRRGPEGWRRGVVFVREVVPRAAITLVANTLYNENYVTCPMRSEITAETDTGKGSVSYSFRHCDDWLRLASQFGGEAVLPSRGSEEEFITEHYWGYAARRGGGSIEYQVEHPQWAVWPASDAVAEGDFASFYGGRLGQALEVSPSSVFVADGSRVSVGGGSRIA